jgi:biopolymer transport protein TolR
MSKHDKKEMNFELDLLPVISMMSVCICFLLLTAVWSQIGSMDIEQGLGQESSRTEEARKASSVWITLKNNGEVQVRMMDSPSLPASMQLKTFRVSGGSGWENVDAFAGEVKQMVPELKTALIMPDTRVNYGDVIRMMDKLKRLEIAEIGIAPM